MVELQHDMTTHYAVWVMSYQWSAIMVPALRLYRRPPPFRWCYKRSINCTCFSFVCVCTFTLTEIWHLPQCVSDSRDHLVVLVQQWPAALWEAAVMQQQPVQQQETLSEQRRCRASPPRQWWGGAMLQRCGQAWRENYKYMERSDFTATLVFEIWNGPNLLTPENHEDPTTDGGKQSPPSEPSVKERVTAVQTYTPQRL